jgi:hypothetical protein
MPPVGVRNSDYALACGFAAGGEGERATLTMLGKRASAIRNSLTLDAELR